MKTRLSSKGQIVLPRKIRDRRQWKPGTEFELQEMEAGVLLSPIGSREKTGSVDDLVGCLDYRGPARSLEEMDEAVQREARRRDEV